MSADIVQFVPFNDYKHSSHLLAREVLMEVPGQLLNYMRKNNIYPNASTEAQRAQVQQQLSMRAQQHVAQVPRYFMTKREAFLNQLVQ